VGMGRCNQRNSAVSNLSARYYHYFFWVPFVNQTWQIGNSVEMEVLTCFNGKII
jgi:hypothetical protein